MRHGSENGGEATPNGGTKPIVDERVDDLTGRFAALDSQVQKIDERVGAPASGAGKERKAATGIYLHVEKEIRAFRKRSGRNHYLSQAGIGLAIFLQVLQMLGYLPPPKYPHGTSVPVVDVTR